MANIIVRFSKGGSTHNVAPYCDQWEKGQIMEIAGLDLSSPITVTFACSGRAASVTGNAKAIQIPDSLLEIGKDIVATFSANDVAYTIVIPVVPQSKPIPNVPANDLPVVDENDAGKVLTVNDDGKWEAETPAQPTPELPSVDASDNGKFLGVSSGEWSVVSAPSGGGSYVVTYSMDNQNVICDKTASEIYTAFSSGDPMTFIFINLDGSKVVANNYNAYGDDVHGYTVDVNFFSTGTDGADPTYVAVIAFSIQQVTGEGADEIVVTPVMGKITPTAIEA